MEKYDKPTAAVDFDGVCNTYTKWGGEDELYEALPGLREFFEKLSATHRIVIYSVRRPMAIELWMRERDLWKYIAEVTNRKPAAVVYIDDRAIRFDGDYDKVLSAIKDFKPWHRRKSAPPTKVNPNLTSDLPDICPDGPNANFRKAYTNG